MRKASVLTLVVLLMILSSLDPLLGAPSQKFEPALYLPPGTEVAGPPQEYVRFADLDGDGGREVVIFYRCKSWQVAGTGVLVLEQKGKEYEKAGQTTHKGIGLSFWDPTGIYDLEGKGKLQIIAYSSVGASCGGLLDVISYRRGKVATRDFNCEHKVQIEDLDQDGVSELILNPRNYGVNDQIFKWNGRRFVRADSDFPGYYDAGLSALLESYQGPGDYPLSARVMWGFQIEEIYRIQRRSQERLAFLESMLTLVEKSDGLESEKNEDKARIELAQADLYLASGDWAAALEKYRLALAYHTRQYGHILVLMGDLYFQQGQYQKALESYRAALHERTGSMSPPRDDESRVYLRMGEIYAKNGEQEHAMETYRIAVTVWPDNDEAWRKLEQDPQQVSELLVRVGDRYLQVRRYEKAIQAYQEALRRNPEDKEAARKLRRAQEEARQADNSPCADP